MEARLQQAGIQLTMGGEPTLVPIDPQGAEWSVAANGPSKLRYARRLAAEIKRRTWPGCTVLFCPGKQYDGEVNPRWALRLITAKNGDPLVPLPPAGTAASSHVPDATDLRGLLAAIGRDLGCRLEALPLRDPLQADRQVWAIPLTCQEGQWRSLAWPLEEGLRQLSGAPGPAGLRLPLQHFPEGELRQVLTLERDPSGWALFLPPLERQPLELLLHSIAAHRQGWQEPELSGVLPWDAMEHWQVLGLTADPGVLEVNLPVCHGWHDYAGWLQLLEKAGAAVGRCSSAPWRCSC